MSSVRPRVLCRTVCICSLFVLGSAEDETSLLQSKLREPRLNLPEPDGTNFDKSHRLLQVGQEQKAQKLEDNPQAVLEGGFCDSTQLARMRGWQGDGAGAEAPGAHTQDELSKRILADIGEELENNNVDEMAKEIFSFYVCVRWVPDEIFAQVAREELRNDILHSVLDNGETASQALAELYQNFKFIPLLCSKNLEVYGDNHPLTNTHFPTFKEAVKNLSDWLRNTQDGPVLKRMLQTDQIFCDGDNMNSGFCEHSHHWKAKLNSWTSHLPSWMQTDFESADTKWQAMEQLFLSFTYAEQNDEGAAAWNDDFKGWKSRFPYHSYLAKPGGASDSASPNSEDRFMICFGKRIASELHRRPSGTHILTDQNNVGCHGWWDADQVGTMLARTVELWKPPTCQLAEMTYTMKKQILQSFVRMNERLFDALPSMLHDETMEMDDPNFTSLEGPQPFSVDCVVHSDRDLCNGMRVATIGAVHEFEDTSRCWGVFGCQKVQVEHGSTGTLVIAGNDISVVWDGDQSRTARPVQAHSIQVVPQEFGRQVQGVLDYAHSAVVGSKATLEDIGHFLSNIFGEKQTDLARMMSGAVAKWVMCPVAENTMWEELDQHLGTEDAAFQEFVKEAYSKWTGFEAKTPGEECRAASELLPDADFPSECMVCDFSELHVDFPEPWWSDDSYQEKEPFMCPLVPPLDAAEQLRVFMDKRDMCLLHMTANQRLHHGWHYQGHWPARRQNEVVDNVPRNKYQLLKLLEIDSKTSAQQVAFGRACTPEEARDHPRFCKATELQEEWASVADMADAVGSWLSGSIGVPVGAISELISNYQTVAAQVQAHNLSSTDGLRKHATALGEQAWNTLLGLGRYAHKAGSAAVAELGFSLDHDDLRHARLESELFGFGDAGTVLHSASFQVPIGTNDRTSNARERFQRYGVVCPCKGFDPAMELALRWEWTEFALRALREGRRHHPELLEEEEATVSVRGEGLLFKKESSEAGTRRYFRWGAAVHPGGRSPDTSAQSVETAMATKGGKPGAPASKQESDGWYVVEDQHLAAEVGAKPLEPNPDPSILHFVTVKVTCGEKRWYGEAGPPTVPDGKRQSLAECMREGMKQNARLRAKSPQTLHFPDEVVVVAEFATERESRCDPSEQADGNSTEMLCSGSAQQANLDGHHSIPDQSDGSAAQYQGLATGKGFPTGAVKEVHLWPEDVLMVENLLIPEAPKSEGGSWWPTDWF